MKLSWILLLSCVMISCWSVNGWWRRRRRSPPPTIIVKNHYHVQCTGTCITRKSTGKRSVELSQCDTAYPQIFEAYDMDDDNKISLAELAATTKCTKGQMSTDFDEADKDDNGFIDKIEFQFARFFKGQKDHADLNNLKEVGEWVSDAVSYQNTNGKKSVEFKVTEFDVPEIPKEVKKGEKEKTKE